jgi:hypothetical protein
MCLLLIRQGVVFRKYLLAFLQVTFKYLYLNSANRLIIKWLRTKRIFIGNKAGNTGIFQPGTDDVRQHRIVIGIKGDDLVVLDIAHI